MRTLKFYLTMFIILTINTILGIGVWYNISWLNNIALVWWLVSGISGWILFVLLFYASVSELVQQRTLKVLKTESELRYNEKQSTIYYYTGCPFFLALSIYLIGFGYFVSAAGVFGLFLSGVFTKKIYAVIRENLNSGAISFPKS